MVRPLALLIPLGLVLAVACAGDDGGGDGGRPGAATPGVGETFVPTRDPLDYPLAVTDILDRQVMIDEAPERVLPMSASAREYALALGVEATEPGGADALDAAQFDIVLADADRDASQRDALESLDVPVVFLRSRNLEDVLASIEIAGQALDREAEAGELAASLRNRLTVIRTQLPPEQPGVLALRVGDGGEILAATEESYIGSMLRELGAQNMVPANAGADTADDGYARLTTDEALALRPDVLLVVGADLDQLPFDEGFGAPATQDTRVHELDVELFYTVPGPRIGEALDTLAKALYPDIFGPLED